MSLVWIISATLVVSLISFVGVIALIINDKLLKKVLVLMIGFAAGSLIGVAFFHLIPEALEISQLESKLTFLYIVCGFLLFLVLERYFYWRHCHENECTVHPVAYLNLVGDGIHNFIDGMVISATFLTDTRLGIVTTIAIILHEVPQELGDFCILHYSGFSKLKALFYNFLGSITAIFGALLGYALSSYISNLSALLLPFSAGGFIYIAASDLLPELHKQKRANLSFVAFFIGLILMWYSSHIH